MNSFSQPPPEPEMIILHAAPITADPHSGPNSSVPGLVAAQDGLPGVRACLVATLGLSAIPSEFGIPVFDGGSLFHPSGEIGLPSPFDRPDLVVFHSTYIPAHAAIARRLRRAAVPYVICPRGGMTRHAQDWKWLKKRLGNLLFFNRLVAGAAALHCLTPGEAAASPGWNRPIFVVGNGVDLPPEDEILPIQPTAAMRMVFMGRLHIDHKGLDMLVKACGIVHQDLLRAGARVDVHGPDCDGGRALLDNLINRLGVGDVVSLRGPVSGSAKAALLTEADVFLHPSRTEGHPIAVLEALAHGTACLLTPNTNMADEVAAAGAGWRVEPSPAAIAGGLQDIIALDRAQLRQASTNARRLAVRRYTWPVIARRSVEAYREYAA